MTSTYIIRHKETKEQWVARSGKRAWAKVSHAKSAWSYSKRKYFDEQDQYEIVELKSSDTLLLAEAVGLLKRVAVAYDRTGNPNFGLDIKNWLEENGYGE